MPFVAECPSCGQKLKVPDNLAGKNVRCSKCTSTFVAESVSAAPPPPPPPAPAPQSEERYDDRDDDLRRSRRSAGGIGGPGRGGMLLTFGIVSIGSAILALLLSAILGALFPPLAFCGWVFILLGFIFGIMAWVMGSGDLKHIRAGRIEAAAEGATKGGYITGMIGTILNLLYVLCACILVIVALVFGVAVLGFGAAAINQSNKQIQNQPRRSLQLPLPKLSHGQLVNSSER